MLPGSRLCDCGQQLRLDLEVTFSRPATGLHRLGGGEAAPPTLPPRSPISEAGVMADHHGAPVVRHHRGEPVLQGEGVQRTVHDGGAACGSLAAPRLGVHRAVSFYRASTHS
jgi:hypothetical protein